MSEISLSPALSRAFEDRVDLGSWAGFTSSLARFLDEVCRPLARRGEAVEAVIDPSGGTLLLTAPVPMVKAEELVRGAGRSCCRDCPCPLPLLPPRTCRA